MQDPIRAELRQAVTDLLIRYASGIDGRDWALLRSCFTEDCDADYGEIGHWHGGDEVTKWMAQTHDPLGPTLHRISNVVLRGRREAADPVRRARHHRASGSLGRHPRLRVLRRRIAPGEDPRIARRRFTQVTTELHPATG